MTAEELKKELSLGFTDYGFLYKGKRGAICPFNKATGFYAAVVYDGKTFEFHSIERLMTEPFIDGKSLNEVVKDMEFYG